MWSNWLWCLSTKIFPMFIYVSVSVRGVSGSFTSSSVYQWCYWVLFLTRVKESNNYQTHTTMSWPFVLRIVVVFSYISPIIFIFLLYFSYNIHIFPIFLLYNYTLSSYILLNLKQIPSYIPIFCTLNVSGRSVYVYLFIYDDLFDYIWQQT